MAYDSSGTFVALTAPTFPAVDATTIVASYYNTVITDLISGLNLAYCRDGRATATGNFPMGNFKLTGLGNGSASTDSITFGQVAGLLAALNVSTSAVLPANTTIGTVSAAEILTLTNVTSDIQAQLDAKAALASPTFTGVPIAPTASVGTNTNQIATMAAIFNQVMTSTLPGQGGNGGKYLTTDGTTASWGTLAVNGGASGTTAMVADLTLTSSSSRLQVFTANADTYKIKLPDATTMSANKGSPVFVLCNEGDYGVRVISDTGNTQGFAGAGQTVAFHLKDSSTANGAWRASAWGYDPSTLQALYSGTAIDTTAIVLNSQGSVVNLTTDKWILATSINSPTEINVRVVDVSGTTPSLGTSLQIVNAGNKSELLALTATQGLIVYPGVATAGSAKVLDVSGSTITAGAVFVYDSGNTTTAQRVVKLSSTLAVVLYKDNTNVLKIRVLSVSGTTVTGGTVVTLVSAATAFENLVMLTATKVVVFYQLVSSGFLRSVVLDISGTTMTAGADVALNAVASTEICASAISGTLTGIIGFQATGYQAYYFSVTGTVPSVGAIQTIAASPASYSSVRAYTLNARTFALVYVSSTFIEITKLLMDRHKLFTVADKIVTTALASTVVTSAYSSGKFLLNYQASSVGKLLVGEVVF